MAYFDFVQGVRMIFIKIKGSAASFPFHIFNLGSGFNRCAISFREIQVGVHVVSAIFHPICVQTS